MPLEGFQFNDTIVGCTDAQDTRNGSYNPFRVSELPRDPRTPRAATDAIRSSSTIACGNWPVCRWSSRCAAAIPIIPQSREARALPGPVVNLFVPPAYHFTFGMRMKMGKVAGIREDSSAAPRRRAKGRRTHQGRHDG